MNSIGVTFIKLVFIVLPAAIISIIANKRFMKKNESKRAYAWGFFLGYQWLILSIIVAFGFIIMDIELIEKIICELLPIIIFLVGLYTIKRKKWALIVVTIFSLNLIVWIANIFYIKNRSEEFKDEKNK